MQYSSGNNVDCPSQTPPLAPRRGGDDWQLPAQAAPLCVSIGAARPGGPDGTVQAAREAAREAARQAR